MKLTSLMPCHLLFFSTLFVAAAVYASFSPADSYLLACGSSESTIFNGRRFLPDSFHPSVILRSHGSSVSVTSNSPLSSPAPRFARVFTASASYKFEIRQKGRHWIRLYFLPFHASDHDLYSASFSVATDDFVLLHNLSFRNNGGRSSSLFFKEYAINMSSGSLTLSFIPSEATGIAFVNAIEVVSIPDEVFPDQAMELTPSSTFSGLSKLAYETSFRLNMGGPLLTPQNDTLGRTWETDRRYLHINSSAVSKYVNPESIKYREGVTPEIAPNWVYATAEAMGDANLVEVNFNMTWLFPIDPYFTYLVRAHFCDVVSESMDTLVFNLYLNSETAIPSLDLSSTTGALDVPYFKDFICNSSSSILTVSIGPDTVADTTNAIINGLEIMKLSNNGRSLAHDSPMEALILASPHTRSKKPGIMILSTLVFFSVAALISLFFCWMVVRKLRSPNPSRRPWLSFSLHAHSNTITKTSLTSHKSLPTSCTSPIATSNLGKVFTFQEIMDATNRFDERRLLGVGGFGRVYEGTIGEEATKIAVKRGNPRSEQGMAEFRTEIEMLSKLRHRHLVSLIGYCDEESEMVLVYEYMANGPLRSHLYGTDAAPLSWKQRLEICIGAARGLHYLHTGATVGIIHRDVKTTNILLDENLVAKVADFGLSKTGPSMEQTHVSTAVKGSFGYLDPEYFRRQQLTEKSDVYSFGVVMVEVICARPALNPVLPREQVNIAEWAMGWQKRGLLEQIVDPRIVGRMNPASLRKYGETAEKCLGEHGVDRPSMGDVLWNLEYALQLEETSVAMLREAEEDSSTNHIEGVQQLVTVEGGCCEFENSVVVRVGEDEGEEVDSTSAVFSQLVNPVGR